MLYITQEAAQHANPYVVEALTKTHGLYMNVYDKQQSDEYDEGRDTYISNHGKYNSEPTYKMVKLLLNRPVQELYGSGEESFDTYMDETFIITTDRNLVFDKEQKFEIFYDKAKQFRPEPKPARVMQCFEVREYSNSHNQWSIRHVMLKPFN